jgi:hypothetical protein
MRFHPCTSGRGAASLPSSTSNPLSPALRTLPLQTNAKLTYCFTGMSPRIVSKSELAELFGCSRARVSRLVRLGLPVRADGKIDLADGLCWIVGNIVARWNGLGIAEEARRLLIQGGIRPPAV